MNDQTPQYTPAQVEQMRIDALDRCRPMATFQLERIRRTRYHREPEYFDYTAPAEPSTIVNAPPLTKSERRLLDEVVAIAFRR